jgi:hypothetical protein
VQTALIIPIINGDAEPLAHNPLSMRGRSTLPEPAQIQHHPAIRAVQPITRWQAADVEFDFMGSSTRRSLCAGMPSHEVTRSVPDVTPSYPDFDNEYFRMG